MLVSEQKSLEEILHSLEGESTIFLLGCKGCAEASHTGGEKEVLTMQANLEKAGKKVSGWTVLDFLCQKALVKTGLQPFRNRIMSSDSLLVMCCGVGTQAARLHGWHLSPDRVHQEPHQRPVRGREGRQV
jgi:hypothetical protein